MGSMPLENIEKEYVHRILVDVNMLAATQKPQPSLMKQGEANNMHVFH